MFLDSKNTSEAHQQAAAPHGHKNGKFSVVSLFAGCGGLDLGFLGGFKHAGKVYKRLPFDIVWANDFDANACESYAKNIGKHIVCGDIRAIVADPFKYGLPSNCDVLTGGFPCQPFSLAGSRKGLNDTRGQLYQSMIEAVKLTSPKMFVAENVKGLLSIDGGATFKRIIRDFSDIGYEIRPHLYFAADYGVAQTRERVLIVGTKKGVVSPFTHPDPTTPGSKQPSVLSVLADLEELGEGDAPNHFWSKAKKNGGQGNSVINASRPGPTMRAEHHGNIEFHYSKDRRLSAREAARIQSFPDKFIFYPSTSAAYKQIGNAVPPVLAWHVARSIAEHLSGHQSG